VNVNANGACVAQRVQTRVRRSRSQAEVALLPGGVRFTWYAPAILRGLRAVSGRNSAPVRLPDGAWRDPHMLRAWRAHDFRAVFLLAGRRGLTAEIIAKSTGLPLDLVIDVMRGNTVLGFSSGVVELIARGFGMPDEIRGSLGLAPRRQSPAGSATQQSGGNTSERDREQRAAESESARESDDTESGKKPHLPVLAHDGQSENSFHAELARFMAARGVGVRELARRTHYSAGYISNICSERKGPSLEAVEIIDRALDAGGKLTGLVRTTANSDSSPVQVGSAPIRSERKERGWPVRKMAEVLRGAADDPEILPPVYALVRMIRGWEAGKHVPSETYRLLYCKAFGKSEDWLFGSYSAELEQVHNELDMESVERLRRTFRAGGLAALTLPALGLDELRHIAAAVLNSRRYADNEVVGYCRQQLDDCAADDGRRGPRHALPIALGLIAAIEQMAVDAKPGVRRELLKVGACASEFAGWLYRDVSMPELANYWRDRAIEWAQVSGDMTMQGYVLLKKSQAAWDQRDALRMLTLAEAAQEGPWRLPARVQAEAAQQQARGHAMLDGNLALVEPKLDEARSLLAQDRATTNSQADIAAHYDEALFGIQVAICYYEAKQPERALELYDRWLSPDMFSHRDYGYFLSLKGAALATANQPDAAARAGMDALSFARETESARTVQEVTRLATQLGEWKDRESVRDLRQVLFV
jgi:transcriptional regulator with XRE-family HTH domain